MRNFKPHGRNNGPDKRRKGGDESRHNLPIFETLESRRLLAANWTPTSTNLFDVQGGPMANLGSTLIGVYGKYTDSHGNMEQVKAANPYLMFQGSTVKVGINSGSNDFNQLKNSLTNLGMQITASSAYYGLIEGYVPINQLPTVAQLPQTMSGHPIYIPTINFQGTANNQADTSTLASSARSIYGVDGSGVTIGVLSDSANQVNGGLSASYSTGDLKSSQVTVLADYVDASATDEGRAMMENIHDIAPGANQIFSTAFGGELAMANAILALQAAGANIIVDDVTYFAEPFFQPGLISQAVTTVTGNGAAYFSSAANADNQGYLSNFRGSTGTVSGLGSGRYMDFDPSSATNYLLPISTTGANSFLTFQFDQPYATQQAASSTNSVTSQVYIYILDASGNVVAQGVDNNVATQQPMQMIQIPNAGDYFVAIRVASGADPGHVQFVKNTGGDLVVSEQYGSAGGTYYPTSRGHNAWADTIGVGAYPWWAGSPYLNQNPLQNEDFSSYGPQLQVRDANGNLLASARTVLNPTISAPDGGNTTFFGQIIDTSLATPPTSSNLSQPGTPSFFGTSSAAPNAAAVAALMRQVAPNLTPAQIKANLVATATTMNGTSAGTWNAQSGYGAIDAVAALNAASALQVSTTTPANGSTVPATPSFITVTFTKAVNFSTLNASNLVFSSVPAGVSIVVGAPVAVDDPSSPSIVRFPITVTRTAGSSANGNYVYRIVNNSGVTSTDGKALENSSAITYTLADTTSPTVTGVNASSPRTLTIQFSEAIDPTTLTQSTVYLQRKNGGSNWLNAVKINATSISYNALTNTVTLDYSGVAQSDLPTDEYQVIALGTSVTDAVGNLLDGTYNGTFPTGATPQSPGTSLAYNLGKLTLTAPQISYLQLVSSSDTGISNDQNTSTNTPSFIGQVSGGFLNSLSGLSIYIQYSGLMLNGQLDLSSGPGGRGVNGAWNQTTTTNADGSFSFTVTGVTLPEGSQAARVLVVGQADSGGQGLSSTRQLSFRIDRTSPTITGASLTPGGALLSTSTAKDISSLTTLSFNVSDPVNPTTAPYGTTTLLSFSAIDPSSASDISNYSLIRTSDNADMSNYIASAAFEALAASTSGGYVTAYNGRLNLTFSSGIPAGSYQLIVKSTSNLKDAAGNSLAADFSVPFNIQSQAVYITNYTAYSVNDDSTTVTSGPRAYYESAVSATLANSYSTPLSPTDLASYVPRADAAPTTWAIDFSNALPYLDYSDALQLIASRDSAGGTADGEFGNLGQGGLGSGGSGFYRITDVSVRLQYLDGNGVYQDAGAGETGTRLVLSLNPGTTLAPDYYRIYMPNIAGSSSAINDVYGNQLDGENLSDLTAAGTYETLLPTGQYRNGLSGDLVQGGAFVTGFVVAATGNIIYARPDYVVDPLNPDTYSDGSLAKPFATLAPEGDPAKSSNLNDPSNFLSGFNKNYDRNGSGQFEQSAFYAASQLAAYGPTIIVALAGTPQRNPVTGVTSQATFVLQAPAGANPIINDGSATVPALTGLVMEAGSTLKLANAALYVQNQGSFLQTLGGPNAQQVYFTSYKDDTIGGDTNKDSASTAAAAGDWGGIIFRNYNQASHSTSPTPNFPLINATGGAAISGSDDVMSSLNFASISYAGGSVPKTVGTRYDAVTLFNSRPSITNSSIQYTGGTGASQAAISGNLDSFREDDTARGVLVRRVTATNNSLNGIWVRPEANGLAAATDAMSYASNPSTLGAAVNYTFDDILPYIFTSQVAIGSFITLDTTATQEGYSRRLYVQPGMIVKSQRGASLQVTNDTSSLNVGDRAYFNAFDLNNSTAPGVAGYSAPTTGDAQVIFTSLYDNNATTQYYDPVALTYTTIVAANNAANTTNSALIPTANNVPDASRWGAIIIASGAGIVMNEATVQFGGGFVNTARGTTWSANALTLDATYGDSYVSSGWSSSKLGAYAYITNNNFYDNQDAGIAANVNAFYAGDPTRPLLSGAPFFRGNVLLRNDINGLAVLANPSASTTGVVELAFVRGSNGANLFVDSVWQNTDIDYVVRGTIILSGRNRFFNNVVGNRPLPSDTYDPSNPDNMLSPGLTLTIQSQLPGTLLADGSTIAKPGESMVVKFLTDPRNGALNPIGDNATGANGAGSGEIGGAGFIVGVDDGVDPPANSSLVGQGLDSQLRIIGIAANETSGQQRVPVIFTSLLDSSLTRTVRGVDQSNTYNFTRNMYAGQLAGRNTPAAGDGGVVYFGGLMLTDYNLWDPRDGSLITDTDISYFTRIEVQGGGAPDVFNTNPTTVPPGDNQNDTFDANDNPRAQKAGRRTFDTIDVLGPPVEFNPVGVVNSALNEYNTAQAMTISNSNFKNFSSAGVLVHPGPTNGLARNVGTTLGTGDTAISRGEYFRMSGIAGQPVVMLLYNNTFSTMPVGVRVNSETQTDNTGQDRYYLTAMNNTFYNTDIGLITSAPEWNGGGPPPNSYSAVIWMAQNNIFANNSDVAIRFIGQQRNSQGQYNVFWQNGADIDNQETTTFTWGGNNGAILGDPKFKDAPNGDFRLLPGSAAIDAARSEVGPLEIGNSLAPVVNASKTDPNNYTRNYNARLGGNAGNFPFFDFFGGFQSTDIVALPGAPFRTYFDQWVPVLVGTSGSSTGTAYTQGTTAFLPVSSQRDINGYQRLDDPNTVNVGFGSLPFFDAGAYEYRAISPPQVTGVTAILSAGATATNFYLTTTTASSNTTPQELRIKFNTAIDTATLTAATVLLQQSGGDGIYGNANNSTDRYINLAGKLSYDSVTNSLIIKLGASGLTLGDDTYRITLVGTGSTVITDTSGLSLDGENTANNGDPNGAQQPLPSGDGFPGGNFFLNFNVNGTAPTIRPGTFQLDSGSDTNTAGDSVTSDTTPTFTGSISVTNPLIQPLAGQIVVIDISTSGAKDGNGNVIFDRMNAGTAVTDSAGNFAVTVGTDAAGLGIVTNGSPLADSGYNVGPDGRLIPNPGDNTGYSIARIRVIDAGGNSSSTTDPNARVNLVVDSTSPTVSITSPTAGSVITSGSQVTVTFTASENLDPSSLNATSLLVYRAGPDGVLDTADDVAVTTGSIVSSYLDLSTGGAGRMSITFSTSGTLSNDLYAVKLVGTLLRDIAGNTVGSDATTTFAVNSPILSHTIFVGAASYATDATAAQGTRFNPYATITAGLAAAGVGDTVAVLPGVYRESVALKQFVHLVSAGTSSTNSSLVAGNALYTVIRAPYDASGNTVSVSATNLQSLPGLDTEIRGFSIDSQLLGNSAIGSIGSNAIGIQITNSDVLVQQNYIIDTAQAIQINLTGSSAATPRIHSNAIIGNGTGIVLNGLGISGAPSKYVEIYNNTIAYNTVGVTVLSASGAPNLAQISNDIFFENRDQTFARNGAAIYSQFPNKVYVTNSLFFSNGPSASSTADDTNALGHGFNPVILTTTGTDAYGNFTGNPWFVAPRDPRPGSDGPAVFYNEANFDLTSSSAAIDRASSFYAPATDLLFRTRVKARGTDPGFETAGPADVGAFEYAGQGGVAVGGTFRIVTTSVAGGATVANGAAINAGLAPNSLVVTLSSSVNRNSVTASDLVLSGSGVSASNPVRATSLQWIDDHTVKFLLSGEYNNAGTVNINFGSGSMTSSNGAALPAYSDKITLVTPAVTPSTPVVTPTPTPAPTPAPTPVAATTPTSGRRRKVIVRKPHPRPIARRVPAVRANFINLNK